MQMEVQRNHFPRDRREDSAVIREELHHRNISKSLLAKWKKEKKTRGVERCGGEMIPFRGGERRLESMWL